MALIHAIKVALGLCLSVDFFYSAAASYLPQNENSPAPTITPAPIIVQRVTEHESFTAVTGCHVHGDDVFCQVGTDEYQIILPATATGEIAPSYTGCHSQESETFCLRDDGIEIEVLIGTEGDHDHENEHEHENHTSEHELEVISGETCHFHAGVEHCTSDDSSISVVQCSRSDRDYNIPLRIGLVFVMLVAGFIGVALPIFLKPILPKRFQVIFIVLKQFGTGVIVATALIHLFTHATLLFANECLGRLDYEAVAAAIVLAGLFIAFLVEHVSHRVARKYWSRSNTHADDVVSVSVLEAGIIFHSLLVGLTLVVAGDSVFITLFVVIVFHQAFEGIALGTRIASAGRLVNNSDDGARPDSSVDGEPGPDGSKAVRSLDEAGTWTPLSMVKKLVMATAFAAVTPVGMAIGIGVLHQFNGNDPSTVIAIGSLDALSAGILLWVGVVEMWATDWMFGGELENAKASTTALAGFGLVAGFILMGVLGKWA
ncbi:hypothetical protein F4825DRAFT_444361 [Nemania diffusa]|nr:hypothetical protein F4825DRAFT_444361 [Nemania diffusa]